MPLPTRKVTCVLRDQFGNPASLARVTFLLTKPDIHPATGLVAPEMIDAQANSSGVFEVDVFPNVLGITGSQYRVRAWNPDNGRKFVDTMVTVPDADCLLHDIMDTEAPEAIGPAEAAAISAQASAILARAWAIKTDGPVADGEFSSKHYAQVAADAAESVGDAAADAAAAEAAAAAAAASASAAAGSQAAASGSATTAGNAATTATGAATAATTAATAASGHATAAGNASTAAQGARNDAEAAAVAADADRVDAQAAATAAAGSATTAAGHAAAAASAQGHATAAAASATSANASALAAGVSANEAEAALEEFSRLYLGAKTSDPATDNEGNPLLQGAWYFRTTSPTIRVWTGSVWTNAPAGPPGAGATGTAILDEANTFLATNQFDQLTYLRGGLRTSANSREFSTTLPGPVAPGTRARIAEFTFGANDQAIMITGLAGMQTADAYALNSFVLVAKAGTLPAKELKLYKDGDLSTLPIDILLYENEATGRVVLAVDVGDGGSGLHWSVSAVEAGAYDILANVPTLSALVTSGLTEVPAATDMLAEITGGVRFHGQVEFLDSVLGLDKNTVGLSDVDNTSDLDKPISTATQAALDALVTGGIDVNGFDLEGVDEDESEIAIYHDPDIVGGQRGEQNYGLTAYQANGDSPDGNFSLSVNSIRAQNNSGNMGGTSTVDLEAHQIRLTQRNSEGELETRVHITPYGVDVKDDLGSEAAMKWPNINPTTSPAGETIATREWVAANAAGAVASVAGKTGVVTLVKADVGLANVDNTTDAAKPVSTAQQAALDLKAPLASPAFTGTPTGITKAHVGLSNVDNTADSAKPVSTAQQTALNLKANAANPAFTGTPTGLTKAHVGLANVDNTADSAKPVSTAQATAIGLKSNTASPTFTGTVTAPSLAMTGPARGNVSAVAASAIDAAVGNYFTKTAGGNLTWTMTNVPATSSWYFVLRLTNGGAYAMTWPGSFKWPGGAAPILTASGVDMIIGVTDDGGTTFRCAAMLDVR